MLLAQLPRGPLPEGCWGCRVIGAVWELLSLDGRNAGCRRDCVARGPREVAQWVSAASAGTQGTCGMLSHPRNLTRGSYPAVTNLQGSRDQTASAGSLFNASECSLLSARQFVGKQTPGRGRNRLAPSLPRTRAERTPPRGALGQAGRDRGDGALPLPRPNPGFRFRRWPRLVATPAGPRRPLEGSADWASAPVMSCLPSGPASG